MRASIDGLLQSAGAGSQDAILAVAMLLERTNKPRETDSWYRELIGDCLELFPIEIGEQREIVDRLSLLLRMNGTMASIPAAISFAAPSVALPVMLELLNDSWESLSNKARWQCLVGLEDLLRYGEDERPQPHLLEIARQRDPTIIVAGAIDSPDQDLSSSATTLLPALNAYLAGGKR